MPILARFALSSGIGLLLLALALVVGPTAARAQTIVGVVRAEHNDEPIADATVALLDEDGERVDTSETDSVGFFQLQADEAASYRVHAEHMGYREVTTKEVEVGRVERVEVTVYLSIDAVPLDPLVVTERRRYPNMRIQEFYERAEWTERSGQGRIISKEDLERMRPHTFETMLATMPMGFRLGQRCQPRIYIDGMDLGVGREALDLLDSTTHWSDIEGVEVYRGVAQIPPQYNRGHDCGAVLVWSKAGGGKPFTWKRALFAAGFVLLMFTL